jgi:hypothetical protein
LVDEDVSTDLVVMEEDFTNFYGNFFFTDNEVRRPLLDGLAFSSIDEGY